MEINSCSRFVAPRRAFARLVLCLGFAFAGVMSLAAAEEAGKRSYDIPAGNAADALKQFSEQSGRGVMANGDLVRGIRTNAVKGEHAPVDALELLLADTGLVAIPDAKSGAFSIRKETAIDAKNVNRAIAQNSDRPKSGTIEENQEGEKVLKLDTYEVTGTHIRGSAPVGSPLLTIDRQEIARSAFGGTGDLLRSLPQNFTGDTNELTRRSVSGGDSNNSGGFGANLRGLGAGATLVLLNGRRLPQAGGFTGGYVDISRIPLSAIERVEVLTDGASAIYGSDAIAGVVNFVLRKQYDGFETGLRAGMDGHGDREEYRVSQTAGVNWSTGNLLISYQYDYKTHLLFTDRAITASPDLRPFGGTDARTNLSSPGTITSPSLAAIPRNQNGTGLTSANLLLGQQNLDDRTNFGLDLLPQRKAHNLFLAGRQQLGRGLEFFGELSIASEKTSLGIGALRLSSIRVPNTNPFYVSPTGTGTEVRVAYNFINELGLRQLTTDIQSYDGVAGLTLDLRSDWKTDVAVSYGREKNASENLEMDTARLAEALGFDDPATPFNPSVDGYFNIFGDGNFTSARVLDFIRSSGQSYNTVIGDVTTATWGADGTLFELPAGRLKLAVGADYREESYELRFATVSRGVLPAVVPRERERTVKSAFGEVVIPFFSKVHARTGLRELKISAAGRYSDYGDVGTSFDPKFGMAWTPFEGLVFRGTWGTSFKAPKLQSLIPSSTLNSVAADFTDPASATGRTTALYIQGNNPNLTPESSTAWTAGMDFKFPKLMGLTASVTFYDIDFTDRIGRIPSANPLGVFLDPAVAPVIDRSPSADLVAAYLQASGLINITGRSLAVGDIQAIVDARVTNLSSSETTGLDINLRYQVPSRFGQWAFGANANRIFHLRERLTATSVAAQSVGRVGGPAGVKLRASASLSRDTTGAYLYVNYVAGYEDRQPAGTRHVASWTTADVAFRWEPRFSGWLGGLTTTLNIRNALDRDPPFVNGFGGLGYDPSNAEPVGRFVSLDISKKW